MSLVFHPPPSTSYLGARFLAKRERTYGPTHGFIDDEVSVSVGLRDNEMGTVRMPAREALYGMSIC